MSGETEKQQSAWTTDTSVQHLLKIIGDLEKYTDRRLNDVERSIDVALIAHEKHVMSQIDSINNTIDKDRDSYKQRFDAAQTAIDKSEQANEKRFESVNEFRKTLSDQTNSFLPRVEYQAHHNALVDRVTELNDRLNRSEGQTEKSDVTLGKVIAIVGISVTVLGFILSLIVLIANGKV